MLPEVFENKKAPVKQKAKQFLHAREIYTLMAIIAIAFFLPGCATKNLSGAGIDGTDIVASKLESLATQPPHVKPTQQGIYSEDGEIVIKTRGKSFLSVLDEVARLRRFNYTVLTDISKFYIDYFDFDEPTAKLIKFGKGITDNEIWAGEIKQQRFDSIDNFVRTSVVTIKDSYGNSDDSHLRRLAQKLRYKWTGDGFVFYSEDDVVQGGANSGEFKAEAGGYKKIFLFNLPEREVSFYISRLLNLPYTPFSPSRGADLPQRDTSPIQNVGGFNQSSVPTGTSIIKAGEELQHMPLTEWQLNSQVSADLGNSLLQNDLGLDEAEKKLEQKVKKGLAEMRWVSIPQQNALIVRGKSSNLEKISEMLHSIDSDYKQIIIEAKVFQFNAATAKKIGLALGSIQGKLDINQTIDNATLSVTKTFGSDVSNALPTNFYYLSPTERRFALLSALALSGSDSLVRITANPRVLLKPGQVSTLDITTTKLVQPSVTNNNPYAIAPPSVQVVAGVFLTVRPTLLSDNKVQLDLYFKQSDFSPTNELNVLMAVAQNQLNTSIIANHGELISLGGQETVKYSYGNAGVPGLKDIGVIGNAFGVTDEGSNVTRVEFMIRAYVHQIDNQLSVPIMNVNELNKRINKLILKRYGGGSDNDVNPGDESGVIQ